MLDTLFVDNVASLLYRNELIFEQAPHILLEKARLIDSDRSDFFLNQMIDQESVQKKIDFVANISCFVWCDALPLLSVRACLCLYFL